MTKVRRSDERGMTRLDWLDSRHTFSFAEYYDPAAMGFSCLRVINEDRIAPGQGFGTHPHRDMEIITWILEGALRHRDSMGSSSVIRAGDIQRMTAGTGVTHSEFNDSTEHPVHLLQIWIEPSRRALAPGYEQRNFPVERRRGRLCLVASPDGRDDSLTIHQDVLIYIGTLEAGTPLVRDLAPGRKAWVQVARGVAEVNGVQMSAGDGARIADERQVVLSSPKEAEVLLFDIP
jgi:quercetin 2,3-dioxygenase